MPKIPMSVICILLGAVVWAASASAAVDYSTQVQPVFTSNCASCHGGSSPRAGLNLTASASYSNLVNVPATTTSGLRVKPGDSANSVLVKLMNNMGVTLSAADQNTITTWITEGALASASGGTGGTGGSGTAALTPDKLNAKVAFAQNNKDKASISGLLTNLAQGLDLTGQTVFLNVSGTTDEFTIDSKGKGTGTHGTLKFKPKLTGSSFAGGNVEFKITLKSENFAADWLSAGVDPSVSVKDAPVSLPVTLTLNSIDYSGTYTGTVTAVAQKQAVVKTEQTSSDKSQNDKNPDGASSQGSDANHPENESHGSSHDSGQADETNHDSSHETETSHN